MNELLGYGLESWYPVVRGGAPPVAFFDALDSRSHASLCKRWAALAAGERVAVWTCAPPGSRPDTSVLERDLKDSGYVERFVVFPGTGGSFTLLPTVDGGALRGGMALLPRGRARGRALWSTLHVLSPLGIAQRLGRPELAVWTKGAATNGSDDLPILPVAGSLAVAAGVPGRNQKIIVRAADRRGTGRAILKIGRNLRSNDSVLREAKALVRIAELLLDRAPGLLGEGMRGERCWMAQEIVHGRHGGDVLTPAHVELLIELGGATRDEAPLEAIAAYDDSRRHLAVLEPSFDPDWHAEYSCLAAALLDASDGRKLPLTAAHGDFTPWNVKAHRGRIRAFDWEFFEEQSAALQDALHFHVQTQVLVRQRPGERIFDEFAAFFQGPVKALVQALDLTAPDVLRLLGLYVLHEGTSAEVFERAQPAPFEQASWLRRARRALCRRLTGLLSERTLPDWLPGPHVERTAAPDEDPKDSGDERAAA